MGMEKAYHSAQGKFISLYLDLWFIQQNIYSLVIVDTLTLLDAMENIKMIPSTSFKLSGGCFFLQKVFW